MREVKHFQAFHQKMRKDIRSDYLNSRFEQRRKQFNSERVEKQQFNAIYPGINENNFDQCIQFVRRYCYNESYNYMLLALTGHLYEYLLYHPNDNDCLLILQSLSQFQEIEIPQTKEFVTILLDNLFENTATVLNIVANLLEISRYRGIFKEQLIELGFMDITEKLLEHHYNSSNEEYEYVEFMVIFISCQLLKIHPPLHINLFERVVCTLQKHNSQQGSRYQIAKCLMEIAGHFKPDESIAEALFYHLNSFCLIEYFNFETEIIHFFVYCIRSDIKFDAKMLIVLRSIKSSKLQSKRLLLVLIKQVFSKKEEGEHWFQCLRAQKIFQCLSSLTDNCDFGMRILCLEVLDLLLSFFLTQNIQKGCKIDFSQDEIDKFFSILARSFGEVGVESQVKSLQILWMLMKCDNDNGIKSEVITDKYYEYNIQEYLLKLQFSNNQNISAMCNNIINIMNVSTINHRPGTDVL